MVQTTLREIRESNAVDITDVKDGNKLYDEIYHFEKLLIR